ncbi:probable prolyl 4-hydroxylase 9 [Phalaenopsis equestris]|uniref:probable prolyl 4-hydroxylase 9 n=1 Tax=Phalaenopsis equestris TaxID=78828 RepID=UPI0009E540F1|nr:probable prolyl 4-hydroxylase 9 [Phalaenopsis equestris]
MKASGKRSLWRKKVGLPIALFSSSVFFLAGFYGSILFSLNPTSDSESVHRAKFIEFPDGGEANMAAMPHGETGEPRYYSIPFQVLSWKPRAVYFPKFATAEQCQAIIKIARSKLKPSSLALRKGETEESTKGIRTSSGTFLSASEDPTETLKYIEEKIARATMIPRDHGEAFNILRYEIGQKYASHYDSFDPSEYGPQKSQRVASFLLYLSDVEEGGETMFPFENANIDFSYDYRKCIGLKVKPQQGDGLLFYSLFTNGTIDPTSLHGSCPVIKGEKWVATKWLRNTNNKNAFR